jgi:hypothetical protein
VSADNPDTTTLFVPAVFVIVLGVNVTPAELKVSVDDVDTLSEGVPVVTCAYDTVNCIGVFSDIVNVGRVTVDTLRAPVAAMCWALYAVTNNV